MGKILHTQPKTIAFVLMKEEKKGDNEFVHASYFNVTLKDLEKKSDICLFWLPEIPLKEELCFISSKRSLKSE